MPWKWLNAHLLVDILQALGPDERDDVLAALDDVLESPFDPSWVEIHTFQSGADGRERLVGWLPHDLVLTYRPYVNGPPPYAGKHVSILAFNRVEDLLNEMFD